MSEISKINECLAIRKIDSETLSISINNNEMLMAIVGQFDQNLKNLAKLTNLNVYFRGNGSPLGAMLKYSWGKGRVKGNNIFISNFSHCKHKCMRGLIQPLNFFLIFFSLPVIGLIT